MHVVLIHVGQRGESTTQYRIFSIKRWRHLFKTRPHRPGVYSNPAFIQGPAFIF